MIANTNENDEDFESLFNKLTNDINDSYKLLKNIKNNFKEISKIHKYEVKMYKIKKKSKTLSGFNKPVKIPETIKQLLKITDDTKLPRTQITKLIYEYIRQNNLQSETDKRTIIPNKDLQDIFGLEKNEQLSFYNIQSHLKKIYQTENISKV